MKKPLLIIIAGPNGSGKTTITSRVVHHEWAETCEYINPDDIAQNKFGSWNDQNSILKAAQYSDERREWLIANHKDLIFETVLSSPGKVEFVKRAIAQGYFVRIFYISTLHPSINASRVARRVLKGGHDVPITKIVSRYNKSLQNIATLLPLVDRVYFYDNSVDDVEACLLLRTSNGKIQKQYVNTLPEWLQVVLDTDVNPSLES